MLIATRRGIWRTCDSGEPVLVHGGEGIRRVADGGDGRVFAATECGDVLVVDGDSGAAAHPSGIDDSIDSMLVLDADEGVLLLGTGEAHLYRAEIGREVRVERVVAFDALECRSGWDTPWGGPPALRSLAATPDGWVYADIHVGSIMRSPDRGVSWEPVTPTLHRDVHEVGTCPAAPGRVYATTARAVYVSRDRGDSWQHCGEGLGSRYGRAVTVHPGDPDCILTTVSDGPHGENVHGGLFRSDDAGVTWQHISDGFPGSTCENIDTFHVLFDGSGVPWASVGPTLCRGCASGRWDVFWQAPEPIVMLAR